MKNKLHIIHKKVSTINGFLAGDHTQLKEVLHPKNDLLNLPFSLAYATLDAGKSSLPHQLKESETYYFLSGHGKIVIDGESIQVAKGEVVLVPPKAKQHVVNESEEVMEFLCIVAPPWTEEGEEIL